MAIVAKPVKYTSVNSFELAERMEMIQGNGGTFYFQLQLDGKRYVAAVGATIQMNFPRTLSIAATPSPQDVTVTCLAVDSRDASLLKFDLSAAQVDKIVSEGVKVLITESGITKAYPVDHFVQRRSSAPGA
jgi:hypothetical protein